MNYHGLIVGVFTFFAIGIFHPIVIKAEYYLSKRCWPLFLIFGLLCIFFSLKSSNIWSAFLGITAFCFLWSIKELYEQAERVERGLYPKRKKGTLF